MLTKNQIIESWYKNSVVQDIVYKIGRTEKDKEDLKDLISYVYLKLLEKPDETIISLHKTKTYNFYITRIILNQIHSNTSDYAIERNRKRKNREITDKIKNTY